MVQAVFLVVTIFWCCLVTGLHPHPPLVWMVLDVLPTGFRWFLILWVLSLDSGANREHRSEVTFTSPSWVSVAYPSMFPFKMSPGTGLAMKLSITHLPKPGKPDRGCAKKDGLPQDHNPVM